MRMFSANICVSVNDVNESRSRWIWRARREKQGAYARAVCDWYGLMTVESAVTVVGVI